MPSNPWSDRARELMPALLERAPAAEARRSLPPATIADFQAAGFLDIWRPARFCGVELPVDAVVELVATVARACPSSAWCLGLLLLHNQLGGMFPPAAQDELWGDGHRPLIAAAFGRGGTAVPDGSGGFHVTGRWRHASAADHASWAMAAARVDRPSIMADVRLFLLPRAQLAVEDTWHSAGLAATGTQALAVESQHVPGHRVLALFDVASGRPPGAAINPSGLFRLPLAPLVATVGAAPALGAARAALDASDGAPGGGERSRYPETLRRAHDDVEGAARILGDLGRELRHHQETSIPMTREARTRCRDEAARIVAMCRAAVEALRTAMGAAGSSRAAPLDRAARDLRTLSEHALLRPPQDPGA